MRYHGKTALVTGASSGIGEQFARDLAARGTGLVLVARRADRLEALAGELRDAHGVPVTVLAADLARPRPGASVRAALADRGIAVDMLVNNAGFGSIGPFAAADEASLSDQIAVNVAALTDMTRAFVPDLVASGDGVLVNVASFVGYQPGPGMAVYAATKAYVLSFTEAIAHELRGEPVRVLALSPGSTRSEFYATAQGSEAGLAFETPEQVVATGLRALDAARTPARVISGRRNRMNHAILRGLPRRLVLDIMARNTQPAH
ncbi:SDR family NAD(P)-dependent oxidoreductase [Actinoplanes sp. NPDC051494]|uniref:SDR family NAD(P)-dependent oxidoreductase n=1 Tax=Actinoplanes sp. NPDC051494 TaxID=3363907 RepID=UPI00379DD061